MAYTRVNWEDLPSTNTPINATNLNKMDKGIKDNYDEIQTKATLSDIQDNLVNVSNEVDEDYRVNLLKSKNLFNENIITNLWSSYPSGTINYAQNANLQKIICKPGDTFTLNATFSDNTDAIILIAFFDSNGNTLLRQTQTTTFELTETAPANTAYMYAGHYLQKPTTIMLNKGDSALTYEPYITPSIYVDNEEIYTKPEVVELLSDTTPTANTSYTLNDNIFNYKYILLVMSSSVLFANSRREYIPIEQVQVSYDYRVGMSTFQSTSVYMFLDLYFDAKNSIKCNGMTKGTTGWTPHLKVYGIK